MYKDLANEILKILPFQHGIKYKYTNNIKYYINFCKKIKKTKSLSTNKLIDISCYLGHIEIVKYLHEIGKDCTTKAMNWAALRGHFEIVKYLHDVVGLKYEKNIINILKDSTLDMLEYFPEFNDIFIN